MWRLRRTCKYWLSDKAVKRGVSSRCLQDPVQTVPHCQDVWGEKVSLETSLRPRQRYAPPRHIQRNRPWVIEGMTHSFICLRIISAFSPVLCMTRADCCSGLLKWIPCQGENFCLQPNKSLDTKQNPQLFSKLIPFTTLLKCPFIFLYKINCTRITI